MANPTLGSAPITQVASQIKDDNGNPTQVGTYVNITTATTTTVKSGSGFLYSIVLNKGTATDTVTLYDNTAGSGTKIGTIVFPTAQPCTAIWYSLEFTTGLTIVTSGSDDITVVYR
jgi:hypothetical protein